jgi:hypothetical protein
LSKTDIELNELVSEEQSLNFFTAAGAEVPPSLTMACHCTSCQRMSASAFVLTAVISP